MTTPTTTPVPETAYRITLNMIHSEDRMDNVLLTALRSQNENTKLKTISRSGLKDLFNKKQILIKGQRAKSSSALAKGITYVDILGFAE
ncbi:MAG: hypothetical protein ACOYL6_07085 [Bacteriovoracaceae bacterium]